MRKIKVLSLFDGMSCGQIALNRAGFEVVEYYASEIDKHAIKVTQANFPNTVQLGDVTKVTGLDVDGIDLLIGGSPCQGFSFAGKQLNFEDPRSKLFFEFVRLLKEVKPKYFFLENVKMKKESEAVITKLLGVEPIEINSALVSAQNRKRLYWTNIPNVTQPEDRGILLKDILEEEGTGFVKNRGTYQPREDKSMCLDANYHKGADNHGQRTLILAGLTDRYTAFESDRRVYSPEGKAPTLRAFCSTNGLPKVALADRNDIAVLKLSDNNRVFGVSENERGFRPYKADKSKSGISEIGRISRPETKTDTLTAAHAPSVFVEKSEEDLYYRKLTPLECERLQTVPEGYTEGVSNTQRYRMLGNGWTVEVIAHIFKNIEL